MGIPGWVVLDVYSLVLLFMLFLFSHKNNNNGQHEKWYTRMIFLLFILIITDFMSRIRGTDILSRTLAMTGNLVIFAMDPFIGYLIVRYVDSWIDSASKKLNFITKIYLVVSVLNFVLVMFSHMFSLGMFYTFETGQYARGSLYAVRAAIVAFGYIFMEFYIIYRNRKYKNEYSMILWIFPILTVCLGFAQLAIKDLALEYTGMILYVLVLYMHIQGRELNVDFLTGAVNRRKFDADLMKRIENSDVKGFSGIMIDIDHFKAINDNYGHQAGDAALEAVSALVYGNFRKTDVISRYGGDEFCVLTDIENEELLDIAIERLRKGMKDFNALKKFPFEIELSLGYAIYDKNLDRSPHAFLKRLDNKMYKEKEAHHSSYMV